MVVISVGKNSCNKINALEALDLSIVADTKKRRCTPSPKRYSSAHLGNIMGPATGPFLTWSPILLPPWGPAFLPALYPAALRSALPG